MQTEDILQKSYYMTLDCHSAKTADEIRHAFRNLVRHYHPDVVGANGITFLDQIAEAYRILSNADRRKDYQQGLIDAGQYHNGESRPQLPEIAGEGTATVPAMPRLLTGVIVGWPSLEVVRDRILRNFLRGEASRRWQADAIDVQLMLKPEDAVAGGVAMLDVPLYYPCGLCRGYGRVGDLPCEMCEETGLLTEHGTLRVIVPAMVGDNQQTEIPSFGLGVHNFYLRLHFRISAL